MRYAYNHAGELVAVTDRSGHVGRRFAYEHGLMAQHTLRGGLLCFYAWQGVGRDARVVRHWTNDGEAYTFISTPMAIRLRGLIRGGWRHAEEAQSRRTGN